MPAGRGLTMSDDDGRPMLQPGDRVGSCVLQTACDLEWVPRCVATRDGQTVELSFFRVASSRALFEKESQLWFRALHELRHPNIRLVHELGCRGEFCWLALTPNVG